MLTLSGHVELFLLSFTADWMSVVMSVIVVVCFPIYVPACVVCFCLTVLVNCLLNAFANCVSEANVFSLKVIVLFLCCVGFVLVNPCMVFQRV